MVIAVLERENSSKETLAAARLPVTTGDNPATSLSRQAFSPGLYLFLGVFALRLWSLAKLTGSPFLLPSSGDMLFYNDWALRILRGVWTEHTAFYGLPLYAYLLAGIYKICGYSPFIPGLLQAACEGVTALLVYKISFAVFGEPPGTRVADPGNRPGAVRWRATAIGLLAALGWAFFVPAQAYSIVLMPTSWLVCSFWFVVWWIVQRRVAPGRWTLLLLGALIGFVAMGVATILFLVPLLLAAVFWRWSGRASQRAIGAALVVSGTLLGAWPAWVHNYVIARDPLFLSAHGGVNFWIGNNPVANGYPKFPPGLHAGQKAMLQDSITTAEKATGRKLKRSEVSAYWSGQARAWIREHPGAWLNLLGIKIRNFWNAFRYDDLSVISTLRDEAVILPGPGFGLIAALALPGLLLACRRFRNARWIAAAVLLHMTSLMSVFVTERYRLAAVPGLLIFVAFSVWALWEWIVQREYRLAGIFILLLLGSASFVSLRQPEPSLWALESYNSGLRALESKKLALAEQKLDLAYAYVPENAELNFALGNLRLAQGNKDAARAFYFAVLKLDPQHEGSYNNLGILALQEKRWEPASDFFRSALKEAPNSAKLYFLLAQAKMGTGNHRDAQRALKRALELDPGRAEFQALQKELAADSR
ncbi:tetratricopeptide repeat protein [soil metagenome]